MFNIFSTYVLKKQSKEKNDKEVDEISKALANVNLNSDLDLIRLVDGNNGNNVTAAGGDAVDDTTAAAAAAGGGGGAIVDNGTDAATKDGDGGAAPNVINVNVV